jgi:hypothetical protein
MREYVKMQQNMESIGESTWIGRGAASQFALLTFGYATCTPATRA